MTSIARNARGGTRARAASPSTPTVAMGDFAALVAGLRATFDSGRTRDLSWRMRQLRALKRMIEDNRETWIAAVEAATLKPRAEADLGDLAAAQQEIDAMIANVANWTAAEERATPIALMPAT